MPNEAAAARDAEGVEVARDYYDSEEADRFYSAIWGGEDIHVGLYEDTDNIAEASRRTVARMAGKLGEISGRHVLDLGAGYGGAARVLAREHGARVTCLNLSTIENDRNRELTREAGLGERIDIVDGSFDDMPFDEAAFDIAWSQDAILHAPDRLAVLDEVTRVLRPGGDFVFTDPMQADGIEDSAALQPIYDRIHLPDLASFSFYEDALKARGFEKTEVEKLTEQLGRHYGRVRAELAANADKHDLAPDFVERMLAGLEHWVDGAQAGRLAWGIMHYRKRS
ncbi:MAG: cyclopropane-fatty-acyl-phospholipid synthase family protein [Parasphingopyxis sp.]|nr:methyltransferase domain-containing protein [Sphingomonadales bacterium]